jgi:hypothetical protein
MEYEDAQWAVASAPDYWEVNPDAFEAWIVPEVSYAS